MGVVDGGEEIGERENMTTKIWEIIERFRELMDPVKSLAPHIF